MPTQIEVDATQDDKCRVPLPALASRYLDHAQRFGAIMRRAAFFPQELQGGTLELEVLVQDCEVGSRIAFHDRRGVRKQRLPGSRLV